MIKTLHHHAQDQKLILTQISKRYVSSVKQLIIRVQKFIASRNTIILQNFKKTVQWTKRFLSTYENWWWFHETCSVRGKVSQNMSCFVYKTYTKKQNDLAVYDVFINFDNKYFNPLIKSTAAVDSWHLKVEVVD